MGFTLETGVSAAAVFLQGILSFFSPCVLPLVPLYIGYLAGGAKSVDADGTVRYKRGRVMRNTVFFVLGVSFTFFALGLGFTALGRFFSDNRALFARIGGVLIILFGLYQLGVFRSRALSTEHRWRFFSASRSVLRGRRASARRWAACSSWQHRLALPHRAFCSSAYIRWGSCCRSWR